MFDSSVWVSAFQFEGTPLTALHLALEEHRIVICDEILREIHDVLKGKFSWSDMRLEGVLAEFRTRWSQVETTGRLHGVCRDPNDDVIVECAVMAGAEIVVTGDKDLLAVRKHRGIRIITPREFLDEFEAHRGD